jgi:arabinofuranosyltransferase
MRFRRLSLTALAVAVGVLNAHRLWWTSDDAYISFRYAANLVHDLGLVYNPGERVEGYSNFLWTLWCALGIRLGAAPEIWANATGIACYGATLWLLGAHAARRAGRLGDAAGAIPWAALIGAVHRDWAVFATGGLETAQFTLFATAAYFALVRTGESAEHDRPAAARWAVTGGLLLAITCLSRPDGIVFAALGTLYLLWIARRSPRLLALFLIPLGAIVAAYAAWKVAYYGDLRPNTYYAKSASRAWWSQGVFYVRLYLKRYAPSASRSGASRRGRPARRKRRTDGSSDRRCSRSRSAAATRCTWHGSAEISCSRAS